MSAAPYSAVFFEDRFVPASELAPGGRARIAVSDPGYLLGEGVFATLRAYGGRCFRARRHLAPLVRGLTAFGLTLPLELDRVAAIADEAAVRSAAVTPYVRVTVTRGAHATRGVLSVLAREFDVPDDADYVNGIPVTTVSTRRIPPACVDPSIKTTSYAPAVLARREAALRGTAEGLQLAVDGALACGTMANLFLLTGDILRTPPLDSGCRAGVTREAVLELAAAEHLAVREEHLDPSALFGADEVFFTSTRVECLPIASVDGRALRAARFPRTTALRNRLQALIASETKS